MSDVKKVSFALTTELANKVREAVRDGEYASASEVVREAIREWMDRRDEAALVRRMLEAGAASGVEQQTIETFLKEARARLAKRRAA
jgi:antitoxin ParD1/3/4